MKMLEQIESKLKEAYKLKDNIDIQKDIDRGYEVLKSNDQQLKQAYINEIEQKYYVYLSLIKIAMDIRVGQFGNKSIKKMDIDNTIIQDINILKLIKTEKLYERILNIINGNNEQFGEGEIYE